MENGKETEFGLNIRPFVGECLLKLKEHFNIFVFTAGLESYASPIIDILDPDGDLFAGRFYRTSCTEVTLDMKLYVKDLNIFKGIDMENTLLVDNSIISFAYQLSNGVPILPFYHDTTDREFLHLTDYLLSIKDEKSLRDANLALVDLVTLFKEVNKVDYEAEMRDSFCSSFDSEMS